MHPLDLTPPGKCECGCGQTPRPALSTDLKRGRVKGQPVRFIKGHAGQTAGRPPIELDPVTDCWEWYGKRDKAGYGRLNRSGREWLAHRWVYERLIGPIPTGLVIDHLCRNPRCVNPEHLEPVTDAENIRRGESPKLSLALVHELRGEFEGLGISQRAWARQRAPELGVAESTLRQALIGRYWNEPKERAA